ncbi:MAG: glycosyltransferase [Microbacteriaceae bacterium]|nr:glycosyltransferase [Microbacteriaceae bacterium]
MTHTTTLQRTAPTIIVIAKETIPGRVKTRLHPAVTLEQAAELAAAAVADTLAVASSVPASRRVLLFDGDIAPAGSDHFEVVDQVGGGLDERLAAAFDGCTGPTVLVGMDTPQLTADLLAPVTTDWPDDVDAWLGFANDGGFWLLALRDPRGDLIRGVPMSRDHTGAIQLDRLLDAGLRVRLLPELVDVDTIDDAREVAASAPHTLFARTLAGMLR